MCFQFKNTRLRRIGFSARSRGVKSDDLLSCNETSYTCTNFEVKHSEVLNLQYYYRKKKRGRENDRIFQLFFTLAPTGVNI